MQYTVCSHNDGYDRFFVIADTGAIVLLPYLLQMK